MPSSLKVKKNTNKQGKIIRHTLTALERSRFLSSIDVVDGRIARQNLEVDRGTRCKDLKSHNVVHTQSMPVLISQEGIAATQEPSRDSDQIVSAGLRNRCLNQLFSGSRWEAFWSWILCWENKLLVILVQVAVTTLRETWNEDDIVRIERH